MHHVKPIRRLARPAIPLLLLLVGVLAAGDVAAGCGQGKGCCGGCGAEAASAGRCGAGPGAGKAAGCCGMGEGTGRAAGYGKGAGNGHGHGYGMRHGKGRAASAGPSHHDTIHGLLDRHESIERTVKNVKHGVETVTTSDDPEVTAMIRDHVRQMKQRVESGHGMRWWDPVFAELFKHHDKIEMKIKDVPGGVRVREPSPDPQVVLLIRQHAERGVSEFVADGRARAQHETPLPDGYEPQGR